MVHRKERRGSQESYVVRRSTSAVRNPYNTRPLVAVETKPPLKEKVRRFFGMKPRRYIAYTPAVAMATTYQSPIHGSYPSRSQYSNSGVRSHYSGGMMFPQSSGGSYNAYPSGGGYRRTTTTTRRRY